MDERELDKLGWDDLRRRVNSRNGGELPPDLKRQEVTREELNEMLTRCVGEYRDCKGTEVSIKYELRETDEYGCNWSDSYNIRPGPKASVELLSPIVRQVVGEARTMFNLKSE